MASPFEKAFLASSAKAPNLFEMFEGRRRELDREKAAKEAEKRTVVRAAQAKLASTLEALRSRDPASLGAALEELGYPTTERKPAGVKLSPIEMVRQAAGIDQKKLSAMDAVRQSMPQGEIGTVENIRAQQEYLASITGAERRAAAGPEAEAAALLRQESELSAAETLQKRTSDLAIKNYAAMYRAQEAEVEKTRATGAKRSGRVILAKQAGDSGQPFSVVTETIASNAEEGELGGELHNAWASGQKKYLKLNYGGRVQRSIAKGIADLDAGFTPVNPWTDPIDADANLHWEEMVDIARLKQPIKKHEAIQKSAAALLKIQTDRENLMESVEKVPQYEQAQMAFDKWWDGVVSRIPTVGGARPTASQIRAEAVKRGIEPGAVLTLALGRIGIPRFRDFNFNNFVKRGQGWFESAEILETRAGGKPVHYTTPFSSLEVLSRSAAGTEEEAIEGAEIGARARFAGDRKTAGLGWSESIRLLGLPATTGYIVERAPEVFTIPVTTKDPQGNVVTEDVELTHRIRRNPTRPLTPIEFHKARSEQMQRNQFTEDPTSPKDKAGNFISGREIWIRVN
tara:strand:- start:8022 stop:9734 length:1713 start_codon:yes stop_codon:yes gene_type:complete